MKNKKLTYKELANYIVNSEQRLTHAINTIGQTLSDFIEFKGEKDNFIEHLKKKYKNGKKKEADSKEA